MGYISNLWKGMCNNKVTKTLGVLGLGALTLTGLKCSLPNADNEAAKTFFGNDKRQLRFYNDGIMGANIDGRNDVNVSAPYMAVSEGKLPNANYFFSRSGHNPNGKLIYRTNMPADMRFDSELEKWVIQDVNKTGFSGGMFGSGITETRLNAIMKGTYSPTVFPLLYSRSEAKNQGGSIGGDLKSIYRNSWPYQNSSYFFVDGKAVTFSEAIKMIEKKKGKVSMKDLEGLMDDKK
jgi:hypothetical protein